MAAGAARIVESTMAMSKGASSRGTGGL
jgi:hypothetical protein